MVLCHRWIGQRPDPPGHAKMAGAQSGQGRSSSRRPRCVGSPDFMPSLLITGGAGFIGSNLVRHALAHTPDEVVVVDKVTYAASPHSIEAWTTEPRVTFVQGDIANRALMESVVERHRPRAILNLAAETHVDRSIDSPQAFLDTNVIGTFTLLEVAQRYARALPAGDQQEFRFLHVSTDEVYGSLGADGFFSETTPYA